MNCGQSLEMGKFQLSVTYIQLFFLNRESKFSNHFAEGIVEPM